MAAKSATVKSAKKPALNELSMVLEPKAMDLLKAVSTKLVAAKSMSFTAVAQTAHD